MDNYDANEALAYMMRNFKPQYCPPLAKKAEDYFKACIEADFDYMERSGVLDGKAYYDDDDAFEFITDAVAKRSGAKTDEAVNHVEDFVDAYMELQQAYMEEKGLLGWD